MANDDASPIPPLPTRKWPTVVLGTEAEFAGTLPTLRGSTGREGFAVIGQQVPRGSTFSVGELLPGEVLAVNVSDFPVLIDRTGARTPYGSKSRLGRGSIERPLQPGGDATDLLDGTTGTLGEELVIVHPKAVPLAVATIFPRSNVVTEFKEAAVVIAKRQAAREASPTPMASAAAAPSLPPPVNGSTVLIGFVNGKAVIGEFHNQGTVSDVIGPRKHQAGLILTASSSFAYSNTGAVEHLATKRGESQRAMQPSFLAPAYAKSKGRRNVELTVTINEPLHFTDASNLVNTSAVVAVVTNCRSVSKEAFLAQTEGRQIPETAVLPLHLPQYFDTPPPKPFANLMSTSR